MQNVRQSSAAGTMTEQFPAGLRVLVVDDDRTCLAILEKMLLHCSYKVTTCGTARVALALLRENKQRFDVVISDVYMPDMDGFKLLELVGLEMDLPVIMMSADGETSVVMKGITHGACDYLLKPIRLKELRNIWQHVIRKRRNLIKDVDSAVNSEHDRSKRRDDEGDSLIPTNPKKRKEMKEEDDDIEVDNEDSTTLKKPRVVWSVDLHQQFVNAVNQLGIDKAVPKRILELMSVQGLTRENVASHLQKYRLYLKRLSVAQHQNAVGMTIGSEPSFSPVDGLPHPVIAPASSQTLAAIQSAYLGRLCSPNGLGSNAMESSVFVVQPRVPPNNQRNLFSGVSDMEQLTQSQILGQVRPPQDGLFATSSGVGDCTITTCVNNSLAEQLFQQQVPHYAQKQGGAFLDFSPVKLSNEVNLRNAILDDGAVSVVNAMPNRSFNTGILDSNVPSATDSGTSSLLIAKRPSSTGMNASLKCEESDSLTSWGGCSNYEMQNRISWQGQASDIAQTSGAPYSSANPDTFQKVGEELLQNQDYMVGLLGAPLGHNTLKVKEEHTLNSSGFSVEHIPDDLLRICYKQEQDTGFFENELGLEGYAPGNLYVK